MYTFKALAVDSKGDFSVFLRYIYPSSVEDEMFHKVIVEEVVLSLSTHTS